MGQNAPYLCIAKRITGHGVYSNCSQVTVRRPLYREAFSCRKHENPEAASAIWGRMLHICTSRGVLLGTECTVTVHRLPYAGHCTGRRFHTESMKFPRQPARYGAECSKCIAKRVAGHGVNRNVHRETYSIRPGIRHGA